MPRLTIIATMVLLAACAARPAAGPGAIPALAEPDPALETAILSAWPEYDPAAVETGGVGARYVHAIADLDRDGRMERFAYMLGPWFCGTGGCTLLLFDDALQLIGNFPIARLPVVVRPGSQGDHGAVFKRESGGGAPPSWVEYRHRDGGWTEVARLPAEPAPAGVRVLTGELDTSTASPLRLPE